MTNRAANDFLEERENLIAIARSIVRDHAIAEELVQESWLRWHKHDYPEIKARSVFRRIVANLAKDTFRRRQRERELLGFVDWHGLSAPDSERIYIARQDLLVAVRALQELPARTVKAYRMHCMDGMTCAEIGRSLNLSRSRAHALVEDAIVHVTIRLAQK